MALKTIKLGFKAFDAHELLCHFLAVREGYYREAGLQVELTDITFRSDADLPPEIFQASCGAALLAGLSGASQRVVFVAVDRPMFWLYTRHEIDTVNALRDATIATYPSIAPPSHFTRIVLHQFGLDPDRDVTLFAARDDAARLGLLRTGNADAAVLSSAVAPAQVEQLGFRRITCLGDTVRLPTTGLATHATMIESEPGLVGALVEAHLRSLQRLHADPETTRTLLEEVFDVEPTCSPATTALYRACFTRDGRVGLGKAQAAVDAMVQALGLAERPFPETIYDFSFIQAPT